MKTKIIAIVCILALCMGSLFAQAITIDDFLDEFEDLVIEVELAAEDGDIENYEEFISDYSDFLELHDQLDLSNWTDEQLEEYTELVTRYSIAIIVLSDAAGVFDYE